MAASKFKPELTLIRVGEFRELGKIPSITEKSAIVLCKTSNTLQKNYIPDSEKAIIICSERYNCPISAKVISEEIKLPYERFKAKWMENDDSVDFGELYTIVQSYHKKYPHVILVTIYRETEEFPNFYLNKKYGFTLKTQSLENGEALLISNNQIHYISASCERAVHRKLLYTGA